MLFPIFRLILVLALLHTSIGIKCIAQPDPDEAKQWLKQIQANYENRDIRALKKLQKEALPMLKTSVKVDCTQIAHQNGLSEPTHCSSLDFSSCPKYVTLFEEAFGSPPVGIFAKECFPPVSIVPMPIGPQIGLPGPMMGNGDGPVAANNLFKPLLMDENVTTNFKAMPPGNLSPETFCTMFKDMFGCTDCYVCNDGDYCNNNAASPVKTDPAIVLPNGHNPGSGAGLAGLSPAALLFLLLLAIASGLHFRWTGFRE